MTGGEAAARVVRDGRAMVAGMSPVLRPGVWVFCSLADPDGALCAAAIATMREAEGMSLIVPQAAAAARGIEGMAMAQITLQVHSALDGVGLTAAVSGALAACGIACNMVAGFHHDHVFVPFDRAQEALEVLRSRAAEG